MNLGWGWAGFGGHKKLYLGQVGVNFLYGYNLSKISKFCILGQHFARLMYTFEMHFNLSGAPAMATVAKF